MSPLADPGSAPPRADLTFLRHRSRPRRAAPPPPAAPASASSTGRIDYSHHKASPPPPPPGAGRPKIDFSRPERRSAPPPPPPADALDLSATPSAPVRTVAPSATVAPAAAPTPHAPALTRRRDRRLAAHEQVLLGVKAPTATLTRVQSGVGHLRVEAVCSGEVGDLRLGAVYQFRSGGTSTVQHAGGNRFAPSSRRPVIVAGREEYERLSIDLRQIRDIERISIYAFSESRTPLVWGGTLVLDTFGGGRLELPLETLYQSTVAVLISLYNLDGELVIRAEMESIVGDVREAARAYGYDRIAWRDDRAPVD